MPNIQNSKHRLCHHINDTECEQFFCYRCFWLVYYISSEKPPIWPRFYPIGENRNLWFLSGFFFSRFCNNDLFNLLVNIDLNTLKIVKIKCTKMYNMWSLALFALTTIIFFFGLFGLNVLGLRLIAINVAQQKRSHVMDIFVAEFCCTIWSRTRKSSQ